MKQFIFISLLVFVAFNLLAQNSEIHFQQNDLREHIAYLASEELKGREPGTEGDQLAARYIRNQFLKAGLTLLGDGGFQYFEVVKGVRLGDSNTLSVGAVDYQLGEEFMPLSFSATGKLKAEVAFVGYGLTLKNDTLNWDDYADIDVKGKWVLVFRADPELDNPRSVFSQFSTDRYKVMNAVDHGAAGVLLVNTFDFDKTDGLEKLNKREGGSPAKVPVIQVNRNLVQHLFGERGIDFQTIETAINETREFSPQLLDMTVEATTALVKEEVQTMNVVAMLEGSANGDEYVVLGGHYDHLGMGGSSSRTPDTLAVHYGADDNASGISMLIEMARAAAQNPPARDLFFIAFGAEEMGLLGSKHYVDNPLLPIDAAKAMLNFDMVGRLNATNTLSVGGTGTSLQTDSLINLSLDSLKYKLVKSKSGTGPSDHSSFYGMNVPVLFFNTGIHDDYHTPKDKIDYINFEGMSMLATDIFALLQDFAKTDQPLVFQQAGDAGQQNMRRRLKVTLGIVPDFANEVEGLGVAGVRPDRPGSNGGIEKGDIITAINGKDVTSIHDYMYRMAELELGETINVEVKRGDETKILIITL